MNDWTQIRHSSQPTTCLSEETKQWACIWPVTIFVILPQGSSVAKHFTFRKNGMFFHSELSPRKPKILIGRTDATFNFSHFFQTNQSLIFLKPQRTKSSQKGRKKSRGRTILYFCLFLTFGRFPLILRVFINLHVRNHHKHNQLPQ